MKTSQNFQFIPIFLIISLPVLGQGLPDFESINQTRLEYNRQGMLILGSWAILNLVVGILRSFQTKGQDQAFHQMNAYWNVVNLGIAGFGFWQESQVAAMNFWEIFVAQQQIEKVLLFNAALDLGYMAIGLLLIERGRRLEKERWIGFGRSILFQGAFLLLFDAILYGFQQQLGIELLELGKGITVFK